MASIFEDLLKKQLADKSGVGGRLGPGGAGLFTGSPNYNAPSNPAPRPFNTPLKKTITKAGTQGAGRGLARGALGRVIGPAANIGMTGFDAYTAQQEGRSPLSPLIKGGVEAGGDLAQGAGRGLARGGGRGLARGALRTTGRVLGPAANVGLAGYDAYTAQQEGRSPLRSLIKGGVEIGGGTLGAAGAGLIGLPSGPGAVLTSLAGYGAGSASAGSLFDALVPESAFNNKPYTTKGGYVDITPDGISGVKAGPRVGEGVVDTGKGAWMPDPSGKGVVWDANANREALKKKFLTPSSNTIITEDPTFVPNPNNLPSSPEAVVANPLQQKMAEYEQGRAKATTQEEMNAVRDLGMSIHQAANPQMYEESYNPLMAATFPERYQKTPEDFIVQGGIQAPRSMTEKDAAQATAFGNKVQNIQGLDVNPMYNPFEAAEEQSMLDKALAAVAASRRFKP